MHSFPSIVCLRPANMRTLTLLRCEMAISPLRNCDARDAQDITRLNTKQHLTHTHTFRVRITGGSGVRELRAFLFVFYYYFSRCAHQVSRCGSGSASNNNVPNNVTNRFGSAASGTQNSRSSSSSSSNASLWKIRNGRTVLLRWALSVLLCVGVC